jgi:sulfide:quinone oxidoreductase
MPGSFPQIVQSPAEDWLRKRGMRQRTEIHYLFPLPHVFPIESVAQFVTPLLEERDIKYTVFFNAEAVDTRRKKISSMEGEEVSYDLPISKSGSAAHFEAKVVAHRIIAALRGEDPEREHATYDGDVMCFLETGQSRATQLVFNYEHPPRPPKPARYYHLEKQLLNRAYWHLVPQGLV